MDLVESLATAMDLISPSIANHHRRVAYISWQLAKGLAMNREDQVDLVIAAMLHDCGALSMPDRLLTLNFEIKESEGLCITKHAETGYLLLKKFRPFARVAEIVRYHHQPWQATGAQVQASIPAGAHILHLADRLDILLRKCSPVNILASKDLVLQEITRSSGIMFKPDLVKVLAEISCKESFWLDIVNMPLGNALGPYLGMGGEKLDCDRVLEMTEVFSHIIDFRSSYTASHSSVVSTLSGALARLTGFSEEECLMMKIAGNLHDLGKLAIPLEILDKPGQLTKDERSLINGHSYYTFKILSRFRDMDCIRHWASYHHEKIDGSGYPFKIAGAALDGGARIVAVADVFTALREDRPYRQGMSAKDSIAVLQKMSGSALDGDVVNLLVDNFAELGQIMAITNEYSQSEYQEIRSRM